MKRVVLATVIAAGIAGSAAAEDAAGDLPLNEFMAHVMQRNAEQLWAWSAEESSAEGDRSGRPTNDEEWEEAESDALTLRQLAHNISRPDFRPDDPRWIRLAGDLQQAAAASADAAERHDYAAFSRAGEAINAGCVACHWAFAPQLEEAPPRVDLPPS